MPETLSYEEAVDIFKALQENLDRRDEDYVELYNRMIEKAVRYAHVRAEWNQLTREEKVKKDESRKMLHDSFISSINIVARIEGEAGKKWSEQLSDNRKRVGDFACYIALFCGIKAR